MILDFIPNFTSDHSAWFNSSVAREGDYTDYYVWRDPSNLEEYTTDPVNVEPELPNNWVSRKIIGRTFLLPKKPNDNGKCFIRRCTNWRQIWITFEARPLKKSRQNSEEKHFFQKIR